MKKLIMLGMTVLLAGLAFWGVRSQIARANDNDDNQGATRQEYHLLAAATPLPTYEPIIIEGPTPTPRVLPPVGRNAGLVIGASVLVLIIIIGILSARLRSKH